MIQVWHGERPSREGGGRSTVHKPTKAQAMIVEMEFPSGSKAQQHHWACMTTVKW
jgi:hypothetical protein